MVRIQTGIGFSRRAGGVKRRDLQQQRGTVTANDPRGNSLPVMPVQAKDSTPDHGRVVRATAISANRGMAEPKREFVVGIRSGKRDCCRYQSAMTRRRLWTERERESTDVVLSAEQFSARVQVRCIGSVAYLQQKLLRASQCVSLSLVDEDLLSLGGSS